jgi:hypothetical protein
MNVIRTSDKKRLLEQDLPEKTWKGNEKYLQKTLAENPELLQEKFDFPLFLIDRELEIEAGHTDIFLIDSQGLPVLVEVKLLANPQSEREVVGQIISYASSLPQLKYNEFNSRVKNELERKIQAISENEEEYKIKKEYFWKKFEHGEYRLIIATDSTPNELLRTWLFENAHSNLDIRLVEIKKHRLDESDELLISKHLVSYESHLVKDPRAVRKCLSDTAETFNSLYSNLGYSAKKQGPTNYAIFIPGWPKTIHYEFNDWLKINQISIEIELSLKAKDLKPLVETLQEFQNLTPNSFGKVRWCPNRSNYARIAFLYNADFNPLVIVNAMKELIDETRIKISSILEELNLLKNA